MYYSPSSDYVCVPPAVEACSFELDVQWIIDIIDKVSDFLRTVGEGVNKVFDIIGEVLAALRGIADWFAWVPGFGEMAKDAIRAACDKAGDAAEFCYNFEADLLQFCKNALAPWEIRSAGRGINEQIVPQAEAFTEALGPSKFQSNATWSGPAAERFRGNVESQYEFAATLQQHTAEFGQVVEQMGEEGVQATVDFVNEFFEAAGALTWAIVKLWAVPLGTAAAVKDVIALVKAILQMVKVWVKAMVAIGKQTMQLRSAAEAAAPSNEWPKIAC